MTAQTIILQICLPVLGLVVALGICVWQAHTRKKDKITKLLDQALQEMEAEKKHLVGLIKHFENSLGPMSAKFTALYYRAHLHMLPLKLHPYLDLGFSDFRISKYGRVDLLAVDAPKLDDEVCHRVEEFYRELANTLHNTYYHEYKKKEADLEKLKGHLDKNGCPTPLGTAIYNFLLNRGFNSFVEEYEDILRCLFWYNQMMMRVSRLTKAVKILEKPHDERVAALKKKALDDIGLRSMPSKLQEAIRVI